MVIFQKIVYQILLFLVQVEQRFHQDLPVIQTVQVAYLIVMEFAMEQQFWIVPVNAAVLLN